MTEKINKNKIVVFSGAGVSAESGIPTFRDSGGLWEQYSIAEVATPEAWANNPSLVLYFYNHRRRQIAKAQPNEAHLAIARLETAYETVVITQNIDNLHERAGSSQVIHVHGEITKARSTVDENAIYEIGDRDLSIGDLCRRGRQLRPHIVWFGENILNYEICRHHMQTAGRILAVGSSLSVYPAAGLLKKARFKAEKILVSFEVEKVPFGYRLIRGNATEIVPRISDRWLREWGDRFSSETH